MLKFYAQICVESLLFGRFTHFDILTYVCSKAKILKAQLWNCFDLVRWSWIMLMFFKKALGSGYNKWSAILKFESMFSTIWKDDAARIQSTKFKVYETSLLPIHALSSLERLSRFVFQLPHYSVVTTKVQLAITITKRQFGSQPDQ